MRVYNWTILVVLIGLTACGQSDQGIGDTTPGEGEVTQVGGTEGGDSGGDTTTTDPETDPGTDSGGEDQPGDDDSVAAKACSPGQFDRGSQLAFDLFGHAMEVEERSCELLRIETDEDGDGVADWTRVMAQSLERVCDDAGDCEQALPSFAWAWSQESEQDFGMNRIEMYEGVVTGKRLLVDGVETIELILETNVTGSTAARRIARIYDTDGKLLSEAYSFNGNLWFEVENQWDGEFLVEQSHTDLVNSGIGTSVSKWEYDELGRLTASEYTSRHGRVYGANFSYNIDGRLVTLDRSVDGLLVLEQAWTYQDGAMVGRQNTIFSNVWYDAADHFSARPMDVYIAHWDESEGITQGECELPAFSLTHGYPENEKIYTLGWARSGIPNRVGFAYGYDGFGWNYGDLSWFGHHGIATQYGPEYFEDGSEVVVDLTYEDGVMVQEEIIYEREAAEASELVTVTRSRLTEAGLIVQDEVMTTVASESGSESTKQSMYFDYDVMGNAIERTLYIDDAYVELGIWQYDENQRITEHGIYGSSGLWGAPVDEDTMDDVLPHKATYRKIFTDDFAAREWVREIREQQSDEWTPVDSGREVIHVRGTLIENDNYFVVLDPEGRQVIRGYGDADAPTYQDRWTADEHGLLGTWEWMSGDETVSRTYVHTCAE